MSYPSDPRRPSRPRSPRPRSPPRPSHSVLIGGGVTTASAADVTNATVAFLDAGPELDALRGARPSGLRGRDDQALPQLQGALPERRRRRVAPAAAVQLGREPGRQGHRARPRRLDRRRLAGEAGPGPGHQGHRLRPADPVDARRLLRVGSTTRRSARAIASSLVGPPEGDERRRDRRRAPRGQRLADRRRGGPDQEGHACRHRHGAATPRWPNTTRPNGRPPRRSNGSAARSRGFQKKIVGVVAANDGTAGGSVAAFKAAGVNPVPPVSGNDATIAGLQLIIAGDQYNTISKPSEIVAAAAADIAVQDSCRARSPRPTRRCSARPRKLFVPTLITAANLKAEIVDKMIDGKPIEPRLRALHRPLRGAAARRSASPRRDHVRTRFPSPVWRGVRGEGHRAGHTVRRWRFHPHPQPLSGERGETRLLPAEAPAP